jgi:hypothetical protein
VSGTAEETKFSWSQVRLEISDQALAWSNEESIVHKRG